jgi:hypothetical protein
VTALLAQGDKLIIKDGKLVVDDALPSPCCCNLCANFPQCISCDDDTWVPMKLNITISGAPGDEGTCDCPETEHDKRRILWDNLNGSYQLEQDGPYSACFKIDLVADCFDARDSDAVLIEDNEFGCCTDESGGYELHNRGEVYVSGIYVCLECVDNQMRISSIGFSFCSCEQHIVGPPPIHWSDWSCGVLIDYPGWPWAFVCELRDHVNTADPCTMQSMQREMLWARPTPYPEYPCSFSFPCDDPILGQLTANLSC